MQVSMEAFCWRYDTENYTSLLPCIVGMAREKLPIYDSNIEYVNA